MPDRSGTSKLIAPHISIVVPVYDVSSYLKRCIESLVDQTLRNIEIILVNDCSPDPRDAAICEKYAAADHRIHYIEHESNRRQGGARNTGIERATGDYIWFVDSDDFVDTNACEFLYAEMSRVEADILAFSAIDFLESPKSFRVKKDYHYHLRHPELIGRIWTGKEFMELALDKKCFYVTCWSHLFRRKFINAFRFREGVYREDTDYLPIVMRNAESVYCVSYAPYYRLIRSDSDTQQKLTTKIVLDKYAYLDSLLDYLERHELQPSDPLTRFFKNQLNYTLTVYDSFEGKTEETEIARQQLLERLADSRFFKSLPGRILQTIKSRLG